MALDIPPELLESTKFRIPPVIESGPDGRPRYMSVSLLLRKEFAFKRQVVAMLMKVSGNHLDKYHCHSPLSRGQRFHTSMYLPLAPALHTPSHIWRRLILQLRLWTPSDQATRNSASHRLRHAPQHQLTRSTMARLTGSPRLRLSDPSGLRTRYVRPARTS